MNKNQKGLVPIVIILIIIIFIAGGIFAWQYLVIPKEEAKAPEEFNLTSLMKEIKNKIIQEDLFEIKNYDEVLVLEKHEGPEELNGTGINWFIDQNEVEFFKGYILSLDLVSQVERYKKYDAPHKITNHLLLLGFAQNKNNTFRSDDPYYFRIGLEKNNIKCLNTQNPYGWILECGDITKSIATPIYRELYMVIYRDFYREYYERYGYVPPEKSFGMNLSMEVVDNFAKVSRWAAIFATAGGGGIWKEENNRWTEIIRWRGEGAYLYSCNELLDNKIPPDLTKEYCAFYHHDMVKCQDYVKDIKICDECREGTDIYGLVCNYKRLYQNIIEM